MKNQQCNVPYRARLINFAESVRSVIFGTLDRNHASSATIHCVVITVSGMHGAAFTLTTVMPSHGALIELFPEYIDPGGWRLRTHFIVIAKWRKLIRKQWWNRDPKLEYENYYTRVPPSIILDFVNESRREMCKKQQQILFGA